jgi:hypothetical protein
MPPTPARTFTGASLRLQPEQPFAVSGADDRDRALQSEIASALQQLKSGARRAGREAEMRVELLEALRLSLAERDNARAARVVESVRANGLRVAAEAEPGDPTVNVDLGSLTRMVEAITELSPGVPSASLAHPAPALSEERPLPDRSICHELAHASREARGRVHAVLESEPDPDRQWQRLVTLIDEDAGHPRRDLEVDLSDNSFLYSR